jgi:hypothetical protein
MLAVVYCPALLPAVVRSERFAGVTSITETSMKKINVYAMALILPATQVLAADTDTQALTQASRAAVKALAKELQASLQTSMKASGAVSSLSVCQSVAPAISRSVSAAKAMQVARTSLKYRNPANQPDAWEKAVLTRFEQRKAKGESIKGMEYSELVKHNEQLEFRYMKAIPTAEVCLKCHGSNIAAPVAARIQQLYPKDKAIGYAAGDIRGAFTIRKMINE